LKRSCRNFEHQHSSLVQAYKLNGIRLLHPLPTIDLHIAHLIPIWPYKATKALAVLLRALEDDHPVLGVRRRPGVWGFADLARRRQTLPPWPKLGVDEDILERSENRGVIAGVHMDDVCVTSEIGLRRGGEYCAERFLQGKPLN
jgi:hypothetical protein